MLGCGFILAVILILAFILLLWWVLNLDNEDNFIAYDECGNPKKVLASTDNITQINIDDNPNKKLIKGCLEKFSQAEHEIDTLTRSYVIEKLCSCSDAEHTYERIEHLCNKLGDYIAVCYGREVGNKYTELKKSCVAEMKNYVQYKCGYSSSQYDNQQTWGYNEKEAAQLLSKHNKCISGTFLENIKRDHCTLVMQMIDAHSRQDNITAMVSYNSLTEKTDAYVENIMDATVRCKHV